MKKGTQFPVASNKKPLLLDPTDTSTDPEDHLEFIIDDDEALFGSIMERNGSVCGRKTIDTVDLTNSSHIRKRKNALQEIMNLYFNILKASDVTSKSQAVQHLEQRLGANCEHAAIAREFARVKKLEEKFGVRIPRGAELGGQTNLGGGPP